MNTPVNEWRSPLIWFGGKARLAHRLIDLMPPHKVYVELFGGGAHVIAAKPPTSCDVYNDIDGDLVNFLLVLREDPDRFAQACETLPYSRALFERWKWEESPDDPFERAVRWFYGNRSAIAGGNAYKTGWAHSRHAGVNPALKWARVPDRFRSFSERMRGVMIECRDFREVLRVYDSPQTLFYADPPYVGQEHNYKGGFSADDHRELAAMLANIRGRAMVSYYPHPFVDQLYAGWQRSTLGSYRFGRPGCDVKEQATELVLANYQLLTQPDLFEVETNLEGWWE